MKFEDTNLPQVELVRDAFNQAYANSRTELTEIFQQQIDFLYQNQMMNLDADKAEGIITEEKYNEIKAQRENIRAGQLKQLPLIVEKQIDPMFTATKLGLVAEIRNHSEDPSSPILIAAALLSDSVRSVIDYLKIDAKFGPAVSSIAADINELKAYPDKAEANLAAACSETKRIISARMILSLDRIPAQVEKMKGMTPQFPPNEEQNVFAQAKAVWGNDKTQDKRLVDVFNKAATLLKSSYKIEISETNGAPLLIKSNNTPQKALPGPKKPIIGDDGF